MGVNVIVVLLLSVLYYVKSRDWCEPNPCQNGKCLIFSQEETYICKCHEGYTGTNCTHKTENPKTIIVISSVMGVLFLVSTSVVIFLVIRLRNLIKSNKLQKDP